MKEQLEQIQSKALARKHLQARKREWQRRGLLLLLLLVAREPAFARRFGKRLELCFGDGFVNQAVLAVESRHRVARLPLGREAAVFMLECRPAGRPSSLPSTRRLKLLRARQALPFADA